jgi:hypothetical protein
MSTVAPQPQPQPQPVTPHQQAVQYAEERVPELRIYSHSNLLYWWPVWLVGAIMGLFTWLDGMPVDFGGHTELVARASWVGVIFTIVLFLVILLSNFMLRGVASVVAVLAILFLAVLFAYLGWWESIVRLLPHLSVHMNLGFYVFFSLLVFLMWAISVFFYDHLSYYVIRPGQIISDQVIGGAQKSWNTQGMVFEKVRQDLFRQWVLGLGSGDLHIYTTGAKREELFIPNVVFVDWKVQAIQKMIATRPSEFTAPPVR